MSEGIEVVRIVNPQTEMICPKCHKPLKVRIEARTATLEAEIISNGLGTLEAVLYDQEEYDFFCSNDPDVDIPFWMYHNYEEIWYRFDSEEAYWAWMEENN